MSVVEGVDYTNFGGGALANNVVGGEGGIGGWAACCGVGPFLGGCAVLLISRVEGGGGPAGGIVGEIKGSRVSVTVKYKVPGYRVKERYQVACYRNATSVWKAMPIQIRLGLEDKFVPLNQGWGYSLLLTR